MKADEFGHTISTIALFILAVSLCASAQYLPMGSVRPAAAAPPSGTAPAFVQQCNNYQSWGADVSCTLSNVGSGSAIIIFVRTTNAFTPSSVTDSNGTVSASIVSTTGTAIPQRINAYAVANAAAGAHTITASLGASSSVLWISAIEISGAATSSPIDGFGSLNCETACSNPASTSTITTSQANELIVAYGEVGAGNAITAGSGFTSRTVNTSGSGVPLLEDGVAATAGANSATWGNPGPAAILGVAVAVKHP